MCAVVLGNLGKKMDFYGLLMNRHFRGIWFPPYDTDGCFVKGFFRKYLYVAVFVKKVGVDYVGCD